MRRLMPCHVPARNGQPVGRLGFAATRNAAGLCLRYFIAEKDPRAARYFLRFTPPEGPEGTEHPPDGLQWLVAKGAGS